MNTLSQSVVPWQLQSLPTNLDKKSRELFARFALGAEVALPYQYIHKAFEDQATLAPSAIAAVYEGVSITYGDLDRQANRLAEMLVGLGIGPGDNVGLFLARSLSMLVGILATLKVGAAYVPQDARIAPTSQLRHVVKTAKTRVILTISSLRHLVPVPSNTVCINVDELMGRPFDREPITVTLPKELDNLDQTCFVLFTSGTTGMPNGVRVTHKNLCNILLTEPGGLGIGPGTKVSQILNIAFDMAAWEILGTLAKGGTLYIRGKDIAETVRKVDVVIATPSVLASVDTETASNVKTVAVAGEPCPKPLADKWSKFATFYNSCGPTEVTIVNTMHRYDPNAEKITIGGPNPNTTVYILDEKLQPCKIGEIGEMWAGGDCVSLGYLNNGRLTAERYRPDPYLGGGRVMFRTRDLGRWTEDGELEHFGRTDDQVKVRGFRVELDSVSAALERVPEIDQAVTLKLDDRNLATFVTPRTVDTGIAKRAIEKKLPYYATPSFIHAMDELPKTNRGKTDKRALTILAVKIQEKLTSELGETRA